MVSILPSNILFNECRISSFFFFSLSSPVIKKIFFGVTMQNFILFIPWNHLVFFLIFDYNFFASSQSLKGNVKMRRSFIEVHPSSPSSLPLSLSLFLLHTPPPFSSGSHLRLSFFWKSPKGIERTQTVMIMMREDDALHTVSLDKGEKEFHARLVSQCIMIITMV